MNARIREQSSGRNPLLLKNLAVFSFLIAFFLPLAAHAQTYYYTGKNPMTPGAEDASSAIPCDDQAIGTIRYNTGTAAFEGCNGVTWADIRNGATAGAAGLTGQVQFNSGGALAASANLFWDKVNGRLGFGSNIPGELLFVSGGNIATTGVYKIGSTSLLALPFAGADTSSIAVGPSALSHESAAGLNNIAVGFDAGRYISTGSFNTALGNLAMASILTAPDLTGSFNTAVGYEAFLSAQGTAANNTAIGYASGKSIMTGTDNTLLGYTAGNLVTGNSNIVLGEGGNITSGSSNILIGNSLTHTTAGNSSQLDIGDAIYGTLNGTPSITVGGNLTVTGTCTGCSGVATAAGSTGQVQFNSGGALSASANLFWDKVNGRLGIGTSTPTQALEIDSGNLGIGTYPNQLAIGTSFINFATENNNLFQVTGNGAYNNATGYTWSTMNNWTFDSFSSGTVGLWSFAPSYGAHTTTTVSGTAAMEGIRLAPIFGTGSSLTYTATNPMVGLAVAPVVNINTASTGNYVGLLVNSTETSVGAGVTDYLAEFQTGGANKVAITSNGDVGIGSATPGTALDVNGGVTVEPTSVTLTANNTVLATANRSYFQLTSDNTTETNRVFCFGAGTLGQILIVEWTSATNRGEIVSHGNCSGATGAVTASLSYTNWAPKNAETILQLMYNGTHWIQIAGSANY